MFTYNYFNSAKEKDDLLFIGDRYIYIIVWGNKNYHVFTSIILM